MITVGVGIIMQFKEPKMLRLIRGPPIEARHRLLLQELPVLRPIFDGLIFLKSFSCLQRTKEGRIVAGKTKKAPRTSSWKQSNATEGVLIHQRAGNCTIFGDTSNFCGPSIQ